MAGIAGAITQWREHEEEFVKAVMTSDRTIGTSGGKEIRFEDAAAIYGGVDTWFVNNLAHTKAQAITHRWRDVQIRAGSTNLGATEAGTPTERQQTPVTRTNTTQIFSGRVKISLSAAQEAANGIYGGDQLDELAFQVNLEMRGILKDIEQQVLWGTEATEANDNRRFKGLIGDVGTYNGLIQATRIDTNTTHGTTTLRKGIIDQWLATIYEQDTGFFPDTIVCDSRAALKFAGFTNNAQFVYGIEDIIRLQQAGFPVGTPAIPYLSPFGPLTIVIHPLIATSGTLANNYMLAIRKEFVKLADFRVLNVREVAQSGSWVARDIETELTLETKVQQCMGILYDFDPNL